MPGCLGLDAMWQVLGYWLGWSGSPGLRTGPRRYPARKFRGYVRPQTRQARYEVSVRQARRGRLAVGVANGRLFADDACVYTANDLGSV